MPARIGLNLVDTFGGGGRAGIFISYLSTAPPAAGKRHKSPPKSGEDFLYHRGEASLPTKIRQTTGDVVVAVENSLVLFHLANVLVPVHYLPFSSDSPFT